MPLRASSRFAALALCAAFVATLAAPTPADARARKAKKNTVQSTGGETAAERDRRLTRECQGRPNSGACLGYAR